MKCYVKSGSTFQTIAQRDTDDYSLVLDSMGGEKSSLTILSEDAPSFLFGNCRYESQHYQSHDNSFKNNMS